MTVALQPGATQIVVALTQVPLPACDLDAESKKFASALSKRVAAVIQASDAPLGIAIKTKAGEFEMEGNELHGLIDNRDALGDIYHFRLSRQLVSLVYVRKVDDASASSAWETVRTSLKINPGLATVPGAEASSGSSAPTILVGFLNEQAIRLPKPNYPPFARERHAFGLVFVQVTVDESGTVIAAHGISGNPTLQRECVAVAKRARFSVAMFCGEHVRLTGIITYYLAPYYGAPH